MLLGKNPAFAVGALLLPASTCRKGSPGCRILTLKCEFQTPCEFADNYSVQFPSFAPGCFCYKPPDLCTAFRGRALHWLSYELGWAALPSSIPWPLAPSQHPHVQQLHVRMSPKPSAFWPKGVQWGWLTPCWTCRLPVGCSHCVPRRGLQPLCSTNPKLH